MHKQIKYSREGWAEGRNGVMRQTGMDLCHCGDKELMMLCPINSRDAVGRCAVTVPVKDIPALIKELQKFEVKECETI
jgi:hypothetical protein